MLHVAMLLLPLCRIKCFERLGLRKPKTGPHARISYAEALKQWKHAATGGDTNKAKAEEKFKQFWMEKFRGGEPAPLDTVMRP